MKKIICAILACGTIASMGINTVFAENTPVLALSAAAGYSVIIGGEKLDLGESNTYMSGKQIMLPARKVAEKLGFKVEWDGEKKGTTFDDGTVNTKVYVGDDSYYMASSKAIGMSAPTALGAAPELKNSTLFVPAEMFDILYCDRVVSVKDNTLTITPEAKTQIPNPFTEHKTVEDAKKAVSFSAPLPSVIPEGYKLDYISTMDKDFLQLVYKKGDNEITYRTARGSEDISGDYNTYKDIRKVKIGNSDVTVRKSGNTLSAFWSDGELSFSLYSDGLSEKEFSGIIDSIK